MLLFWVVSQLELPIKKFNIIFFFAQASPASTNSIVTVLIDTPIVWLIERIDMPSTIIFRFIARILTSSLFMPIYQAKSSFQFDLNMPVIIDANKPIIEAIVEPASNMSTVSGRSKSVL